MNPSFPAQRLSPFLFILVSFLTLLVYLPALQNGFVNWDDGVNVTENPHIRAFTSESLRWMFTDMTVSYWQPVIWASHAVDFRLWGLDPRGHHLTNILLHAINTLFVMILAARLMEVAAGSVAHSTAKNERTRHAIAVSVTGLLFGLHPLHVESVAWVSERKDLLSTLFFLLCVLAYVRYARFRPRDAVAAGTLLRDRWYVVTLLLFVLALASKPMVVTLPVILLLLDWYPLGRLASLAGAVGSVKEKMPLFLLSGALAVATIVSHQTHGALRSLNDVPVSGRIAMAAKASLAYLGKMVLPLNLVPVYPDPKEIRVFSVEYLSAIVLVAGITVLCLVLARKYRIVTVAWGFYLITLLPVLGLVKTTAVTVSDRFTYLPSVGPFLLAGAGAARLWSTASGPGRAGLRNIAATAGVMAVIVLSFLTIRQTAVWRSSADLWNYVIEKEPEGLFVFYNNRGLVLHTEGKLDQALSDFTREIELNPHYAEAYNNRGIVLGELGRFDEAIGDFSTAVEMDPSMDVAYLNRGVALERIGSIGRAIDDYTAALALSPGRPDIYMHRGIARGSLGDWKRAEKDFTSAITLGPDDAEAYWRRGVARERLGRHAAAIADQSQALARQPASVAALMERGDCYARTGDAARAADDYETACRLGYKDGCALASRYGRMRGRAGERKE